MTAKIQVTNEQLLSMLIGAFEGGSNYWYTDLRPELPAGMTRAEAAEKAKAAEISDEFCANHRIYQAPFAGGKLIMRQGDDAEQCPHDVTMERMQAALHLLATQRPDVLAEIVGENDDASTADTFLQFCVLGELVYG